MDLFELSIIGDLWTRWGGRSENAQELGWICKLCLFPSWLDCTFREFRARHTLAFFESQHWGLRPPTGWTAKAERLPESPEAPFRRKIRLTEVQFESAYRATASFQINLRRIYYFSESIVNRLTGIHARQSKRQEEGQVRRRATD